MIALRRLASLMLITAAIGMGSAGLYLAGGLAKEYKTWPTVEAAVEEVRAEPIGNNKYGHVLVRLRYFTGFGDRQVWASKYVLASRGEKFMHTYAVGTYHKIWLDPALRPAAEIGLGWNLETLLVPFIALGMSVGLLVIARYSRRFL